ncbi:type II secretion system F family protein [Nocardioides sp. NPDC051685]|uniref:type II secretion system F family protein n=1 Tax=Nocardioides sp. NPDC051685 TaxID=3364334 RepID=UPI00379BDD4A
MSRDVAAGSGVRHSLRAVLGGTLALLVSLWALTPAAAVAADAQPGGAAVVIVLDASGSMQGERLASARKAAESYLDALPDDIPAGLVTFSGPPQLTVPLTTDRERVGAAVRAAQAHDSTYLYDAVVLGAQTLAKSPGTRKMLVLSDGEDTSSKRTLEEALGILRKYGITTDMGVLDAVPASGARSRLVEDTDGRMLTAEEAKDRATELVPAPRAAAPAAAPPGWLLTAGVAALFAGFAGVAVAVLGPLSRDRRRERALAVLARYRVTGTGAAPQDEVGWSSPLRHALTFSEHFLDWRGRREQLATDLGLAGMSLKPAEWLLVRTCTSIGLGVLTMVVGAPWFVGVIVALLAWFATRAYLKIRISRRRTAFGEQLPDTLNLLVAALRTGFSLPQALDGVVRNGTEPIAGELARALARTRLGVSVEDALDKAAERMKSADFAWVVMAIRIQRQVGGNLTGILETTARTMRERVQLRRHVKALSAEGRMSAYVLIGLPIVLAGLMLFISREYIALLYTTPLGWVLMIVGVGFMSVGWFWMNKLIKVEE